MNYFRTSNLILAIAFAAFAAGCFIESRETTSPVSPTPSEQPKGKAVDTAPADESKNTETKTTPVRSSIDKSTCLKAKKDGMRLIASQTFVFDHEPFTGSCFVTFGNIDDMVDETDVPRGSTFHIFKDGKIVYDFPDAFAGTQACWVEAVGFNDLNGDGETDVVIAGRCLAARDSYPQNAVFVNTGTKFTTDENANESLNEFETVKAISQYVERNLKKFF
ncbi:MAG TPA: hypothetical protein PKM58_02620 [Pyrinomonadaceae bacterium]|nr:hypothetical protein [Pyrinomonadaceae bacterium]